MKRHEIEELLDDLLKAAQIKFRADSHGQPQDWAEAQIFTIRKRIIKEML